MAERPKGRTMSTRPRLNLDALVLLTSAYFSLGGNRFCQGTFRPLLCLRTIAISSLDADILSTIDISYVRGFVSEENSQLKLPWTLLFIHGDFSPSSFRYWREYVPTSRREQMDERASSFSSLWDRDTFRNCTTRVSASWNSTVSLRSSIEWDTAQARACSLVYACTNFHDEATYANSFVPPLPVV